MDGKEHAWQLLRNLEPAGTCRRALVEYDACSEKYRLVALGQDFRIDRRRLQIQSHSPIGQRLLQSAHLFDLCLLWYLIGAQQVAPTGRLITPEETKGGQIYRQGAHVLPLAELADRYDRGEHHFLAACRELGGISAPMGDVACRLLLFPRLPVTLILWHGDEEFAAGASLLFDASCEMHLPQDAIWAAATTLVHFLLEEKH